MTPAKHVAMRSMLAVSLVAAAASPAVARPDAAAHNAAFEAGTKWGTSAQTTSEMLECSEIWSRWQAEAAAIKDLAFVQALTAELAADHARQRAIYWQRMARRNNGEREDLSYFGREQKEAAAKADRLIAAYRKDDPKGLGTLMEYLGICR